MSKGTGYMIKTTSILTISAALGVLAGWFFNIPLFRSVLPGIVEMKFNTAICFILSGIALFFLDGSIPHKIKIYRISSVVVLVAGLLNLCQFLFGWNLGIDELLWTEGPGEVDTSFPGRMSMNTTINFILFSLIFLLLNKRKTHWFIQATCIFIFSGSLLVLLNYVFGTSVFKNIPQLSNTALPTAFLFMVLSIGVFYSEPLRYLKFSFEKKIAGFFILTALVLAFTFYAFMDNESYTLDTVKQLEHTNEISLTSQVIRTEADEMQSGARGFVITGKENYLPLFHNAASNIEKSVILLKALTKDNPRQLPRIDTLDELINNYINETKELISLRRNRGFDAAKENMETGRGKRNMDSIRAVIISIQQEANQLLVKRKAENRQSMANSSKVIRFFQVIAVLLMLLVFMIIYKNTRARNKAEVEMIAANKRFTSIFNLSPVPVCIISIADGRFMYLNNMFCESLGYKKEELIGKKTSEVQIIDEAGREKLLQQNPQSGNDANVPEIKVRKANGELRDVLYSVEKIEIDNQACFAVALVDITERKKGEDELKQFKHFFNNSNDFSCIANTDGYFDVVNPNFEKLLGYSQNELLKYQFLHFIHPDDIAATLQEVEKLKTGAVTINFENRYRKKNGEYLWFDWNTTPDPVTGKLYAIARDITERKTLEDKLNQFNRELEQKVKDRTAELQASNIELERFAYVASHDLQEPLRMVSSFLNLLKTEAEGKLDKECEQYIDFAVDGAQRMKNLIQDLLQFSRAGTSKEPVKDVDCNEILHSVNLIFESELTSLQGSLKINPLPTVKGIQSQLQQLFQNLISNAMKYHNNRPPQIEVGCTEKNGYWQFYVEDNGIGIDPKYFDKIFILFQRLHTRTEYSGTGIGLAVCKKIIEKHGGRIWVESKPDKGSTFYFTLPKNIYE